MADLPGGRQDTFVILKNDVGDTCFVADILYQTTNTYTASGFEHSKGVIANYNHTTVECQAVRGMMRLSQPVWRN
jgi:hypothetical protein